MHIPSIDQEQQQQQQQKRLQQQQQQYDFIKNPSEQKFIKLLQDIRKIMQRK